MSDAWEEIQAIKTKRNTLREKLQKRKRDREDLLNSNLTTNFQDVSTTTKSKLLLGKDITGISSPVQFKEETADKDEKGPLEIKPDPEIEIQVLKRLCEVSLILPTTSEHLTSNIAKTLNVEVQEQVIINLLQKFAAQQLIVIKENFKENHHSFEIVTADHSKLLAMANEYDEKGKSDVEPDENNIKKRRLDKESEEEKSDSVKSETIKDDVKEMKEINQSDINFLLSMPSIKEKETKKVGEEIMDLLSKPTAKERSLAERFRSQGGAQVMEFCPHGTKLECQKSSKELCKKLHFKKIIQSHTDEALGDCSFLNTCFHMDTCKYVHYEVDNPKTLIKDGNNSKEVFEKPGSASVSNRIGTILYPPQWIQCDLRYLDMRVLGKFAVIMADPPWDIHMELPYGTLSDDEMRQLGVPQLQDDGLIFLWVTGRAMELGRECLQLWGYERVDELIWVKTNQLQRIIRTGRTGHWLNHGKEHCLVGLKGNPEHLNRGLDCDVIVAEVRATSHKPDEIYGIIERLSPGTRKIELFGRPHNIQPNWITLGNQVDGVRLVDPELIEAFKKTYPDGNCMLPPVKS
ncbi:conserved hypothetical protein [Pediculus humanus corporis]|uniref:mRNA m(6)A methyltransferase n=1 Tax=Pediculus humanus subsp. corporis TaxID=121224 RepID=E0VST8_PEDHC|nr:uncharacterized protein Phum_PHUM423190 [Pediculus humanus corporis]EEB16444.1 conserved hypothetical protein [Pediculus humanus corporis]